MHFIPLHDDEWKDDLSQNILISRIPKFLQKKYFRASHWSTKWWKRRWFSILLAVSGKKSDVDIKELPWAQKIKELGFAASVVIAHAGSDPILAKSRIREVS